MASGNRHLHYLCNLSIQQVRTAMHETKVNNKNLACKIKEIRFPILWSPHNSVVICFLDITIIVVRHFCNINDSCALVQSLHNDFKWIFNSCFSWETPNTCRDVREILSVLNDFPSVQLQIWFDCTKLWNVLVSCILNEHIATVLWRQPFIRNDESTVVF